MKNHKGKLFIIGGLLFFILQSFFSAYVHFAWADKVKSQTSGYTVIYEGDSGVDILEPWTFFKRPTSHIWFVSDVVSPMEEFMFAEVLMESLKNSDKFYTLVHCEKKLYTFFYEAENLDHSNLNWKSVDEENYYSSQLIKFVCE